MAAGENTPLVMPVYLGTMAEAEKSPVSSFAVGTTAPENGANAVQAARGRVGAAAEFAACVQPRHHELDPGQPGLRLDVDGDTTPVVFDLGGMIGVQDDVDAGAATGKCLIDGIVDYLPQAVQQPPAVGGSDVHAGALAHRLKPFKHGQMARCVAVGTDFGHRLGADGGH